MLVEQQGYDEAASAQREALEIARASLRSEHQLVAIYTINAGSIHLAREEPATAEALLREGLRIRAISPGTVPSRRRTFLEGDWSVGATKSLLGAALVALRRYEEAEAVLLEAHRDLDVLPVPSRSHTKATLSRLVDLYVARVAFPPAAPITNLESV